MISAFQIPSLTIFSISLVTIFNADCAARVFFLSGAIAKISCRFMVGETKVLASSVPSLKSSFMAEKGINA